MSKQVLTDALIAAHGYDLSDTANAVTLEYGVDPIEATAFGDDTQKFMGGLKTVSMGAEGYWQATPDGVLFSRVGITGGVVTVAARGDAGDPAYSFEAMVGDYNPGGAIGERFGFSLSAAATARLFRGTVIARAAAQAAGNGVARNLGAVSADQQLHLALHVFSITGSGSVTVSVESDAANTFAGAETTRATFSALSDVGSEFVTVDGAITDTWWRPVFAFGGGATAASVLVVLGIQ